MSGATIASFYTFDIDAVVLMESATSAKIRSFAKLPAGWHYGRGVPPSDDVVARALSWYRLFQQLGFAETDAFPGVRGEIAVTAYEGDHYISVGIEPDGTLTVLYQREGLDVVDQEGLSNADARAIIVRVGQEIEHPCAMSDWFTQTRLIPEGANFTIMRSRTMERTIAPPSLMRNVLRRIPLQSVHTSANTLIGTLLESRQYFGYSITEHSTSPQDGLFSRRHQRTETFVTTT
jgi:hypothetical protein